MACSIKIHRALTKKVEELSEEGLTERSLSEANKIASDINTMFGEEVVSFVINERFEEDRKTLPKVNTIESIKASALKSFLNIQDTPEFRELTSKRFDSNGSMKFDFTESKYYKTKSQATIVANLIREKIYPLVNKWSVNLLKGRGESLPWFDITYSPKSVKLDLVLPSSLKNYYEDANKHAETLLKKIRYKKIISISGELVEKYKQNEERLEEDSITTSNRKEPSDIENSDNVSIFRPQSSKQDIENYKRTCGL